MDVRMIWLMYCMLFGLLDYSTMASEEEVSLVVAFDFGTSFSGYAYSYGTDKEKIYLNKPWKGLDTYKTSTSVLLNPIGAFDSFGYDAEKKYSELKPEHQKLYKLFDKFKMTLDKDNLYGEHVKVISRNGEERDAIEIFAFAVRSMKDRLLKELTERHGAEHVCPLFSESEACGQSSSSTITRYGIYIADSVQWVITVPAIWSEGAKQFMRRVAVKSGLIHEIDSSRLMLALEPEAASIYFRNMDLDKFNPETKDQKLSKGTEYIILDCGGGTVDVSAHRVLDKGCVEEIYRATGGPWGGNNVNRNFEKLLRKILGEDFIAQFIKNQPGSWFDILTEFERRKREINTFDESFSFPISKVLSEEFETYMLSQWYTENEIEDAITNCNLLGIAYLGGKLVVQGNALDDLFEPVASKIVGHLQNLLQKDQLQDVKYIILVGGFSDSPYLKKAIKDQFEILPTEKKYRVLVAEGAEIAVVKGAVMYGNNPPAIQSRVARYSYGFHVNCEFEPHHMESCKRFDPHLNSYICDRCFYRLIKQGESIKFGEVRSGYSVPMFPEQSEALFNILAADKEDVTYSDEKGVTKIGSLTITFTNNGNVLDKSFKTDFILGGTEMQVSVTEEGGNAEAHATLQLSEDID